MEMRSGRQRSSSLLLSSSNVARESVRPSVPSDALPADVYCLEMGGEGDPTGALCARCSRRRRMPSPQRLRVGSLIFSSAVGCMLDGQLCGRSVGRSVGRSIIFPACRLPPCKLQKEPGRGSFHVTVTVIWTPFIYVRNEKYLRTRLVRTSFALVEDHHRIIITMAPLLVAVVAGDEPSSSSNAR